MSSDNRIFTDMEIDTIGEILNISMGAAATAVSNLLDKKVSITTPKVEVVSAGEYEFKALEPAIGVTINYIDGLEGTNLMILKEDDVKKIVGILLQCDFTEQEFQMDEMSISAICEVMNQMMGSASTAMSQMLNRVVNISTPESFAMDGSENIAEKYFKDNDHILSVKFRLNIDGITDSEFASVIPMKLAEELVNMFANDMTENDEPVVTEEPDPAPIQEAPVAKVSTQAPRPIVQEPPRKSAYDDAEVTQPELESYQPTTTLNDEQQDNLKLLMNVPLHLTAEVGRTKMTIKDILSLTSGSVVELSKQAGTPVDILVNGQTIAKGDVVVIEEYFGVRITEILKLFFTKA